MRKIIQEYFFYFLFCVQKYWFIMIRCVGALVVNWCPSPIVPVHLNYLESVLKYALWSGIA
jgi:hypothetical protein